MSSYLKGTERSQVLMLPECVEDYVSADNPVRVVEAFVAQLDLATLDLPAGPQATGRPGYDPRDLLALYVYGYVHRIRSSRELERQTQRNLEVLWLLRGLRPDHKTISEFRRRHAGAFKGVLRQFNLLCRELDLFGRELVAIDGTVIKAVNARSRNHTRQSLRKLLARVDRGIERYLKEAEALDQAETREVALRGDKPRLAEKLAKLQQRKARCQELLADLESSGATQVSLTDPQSQLIKKQSGGAAVVGYNVQSVVDARHHLIVVAQASQQSHDFGQLAPMAVAARDELQVQTLEVLADSGYRSAEDLAQCEAAGICAHVPGGRDAHEARGLFGRQAFIYDAVHDHYRCPGQQLLQRHQDTLLRGQPHQVYYNLAACSACALRTRCTRSRYRKLKRARGQEAMEAAAARVKAHPEIYARRKEMVEHPFGTQKFWWGYGAFLLRRRQKVNAEVQLSALAYNLRRVLNLLGVPRLLQHLRSVARTALQHPSGAAILILRRPTLPILRVPQQFFRRSAQYRAAA